MNFDKRKNKNVHIRLSELEYENMEKICKLNDISYSSLFRTLLNNYCDKIEEVKKLK